MLPGWQGAQQPFAKLYDHALSIAEQGLCERRARAADGDHSNDASEGCRRSALRSNDGSSNGGVGRVSAGHGSHMAGEMKKKIMLLAAGGKDGNSN